MSKSNEDLLAIEAAQLRDKIAQRDDTIFMLKTEMIAAAEEIMRVWPAHCDEEGYGPSNLMHRLEKGIPSLYGYTAGAFKKMDRINTYLIIQLLGLYNSLQILSSTLYDEMPTGEVSAFELIKKIKAHKARLDHIIASIEFEEPEHEGKIDVRVLDDLKSFYNRAKGRNVTVREGIIKTGAQDTKDLLKSFFNAGDGGSIPKTNTPMEAETPEVKPASVGRIVHYFPSAEEKAKQSGGAANYADASPAIVTRVWSNNLVNMRVFCDSEEVALRTSVQHKSNAQEGSAHWDWPEIK